MQSSDSFTRILNDWAPVVRSLLGRFTKAGYTIHSVDDGEERHSCDVGSPRQQVQYAAECVCGVDEAHVYLRKGDAKVTLFLVLGNAPCETVCDYGASDAVMSEVERVVDAFGDSWEGRRCPTRVVPSLR